HDPRQALSVQARRSRRAVVGAYDPRTGRAANGGARRRQSSGLDGYYRDHRAPGVSRRRRRRATDRGRPHHGARRQPDRARVFLIPHGYGAVTDGLTQAEVVTIAGDEISLSLLVARRFRDYMPGYVERCFD